MKIKWLAALLFTGLAFGQGQFSGGGSSGSTGVAAAPVVTYAQNGFGLKYDGQYNFSGAWTNGSSTITCAGCNFAANQFDASTICFGTNWGNTGFGSMLAAQVQLPEANCQFVNSTTITTSATTSSITTCNSSNQCFLVWGHIDDTGLSAAWTSTAGFNNFTGTITASGTGQAANPTIVYTFPNPYWNTPQYCTATQVGGTQAQGQFTSSSLSATGVTFTYSGTPGAGSTVILHVECYN